MPGPLIIFPLGGIAAVGLWFWKLAQASKKPRRNTAIELADLIARRLGRQGRQGEWEEFLRAPQVDPGLDALRLQCLNIEEQLASPESHRLYTEAGQMKLEAMIQMLKDRA